MPNQRSQRRLAAILAADVVGYSTLMRRDEEGTLAALKRLRERCFDPAIEAHRGRLLKLIGDGALVEFASIVDAVECAIRLQREIAADDVQADSDRRIAFRIGINLGDVIVEGDDVYGDGVNVAARVEAEALPGTVCLSEDAHRLVAGKVDAAFEDLGPRALKNIAEPVRIYQIRVADVPGSSAPGPMKNDRPSIAVLPFDPMSTDTDQEIFARGLTEDLITALSLWRTFDVIAKSSTLRYEGPTPDPTRAAQDLGVGYVVVGSVRTAKQRVRITARLIDIETSRPIWSERYDREIDDFFDLQDEIAREIAAHVEPAFARDVQEKAKRKPPASLAAWEWRQRGIALLDGFLKAGAVEGQAGTLGARECFQRAMDLDPADSSNVSWFAYAHFRAVFAGYSDDPPVDIARALEFGKRAVALDDRDPHARFACSIGWTYSGRPDLGVIEARRAVELNPNYSHAYVPLGNGLNLAGRPDEAIPHLETAIRLNPADPRNHAYYTFLAEAHLNNRDYGAAIGWARRAIEWNADYPYSYCVLAAALGLSGDQPGAAAALADALRIRPD